jgi:hypothetical protein
MKEDLLERAVRLAYYIVRDQQSAERIAAEAVVRLDVAVVKQDRRYYYVPRSRREHHSGSHGQRTKVTLGELHLLQRLVYDESESYEREQEKLTPPEAAEERLIVHFIKHLIRITLKRNSFYVTLGVSRLLYHYSTAEAMELYNLIVQNPSRVKDDYYWRSRKSQLMQEVRARFGDLIAVGRVARGEDRFVARDDSLRYADFVQECLQTLMPWNTDCPLPTGEGPVSGVIPALDFDGDDPDEEHRIEIARIHAVMHFICLDRLTAGLRLDTPATRLELPKFFLSGGHNQNNQVNINTPQNIQSIEMNPPDLNSLRARLAHQESLRRKTRPERLRILVDRRQRALLDLSAADQIGFDIAEGEEFIEVCAGPEDGDVRLALYPIDRRLLERIEDAAEFVIELASGDKLKLALKPNRDQYGELLGAAVTVSRQRVHILNWILNWLRIFRMGFAAPAQPALAPHQALVLALTLIIVSVAFGLLVWRGMIPDQMPLIATVTPEVTGSPSPSATPANVATAEVPSPRPSVRTTRAPNSHPTPPSQTRNPGAFDPNAIRSLSQAKQIFVLLNGDGARADALRKELNRRLQASQRWTIASREDADSALSVTFTSGASGASAVAVQLVNANGRVIWPQDGKRRVYSGPADKIAARIVADLLADARKTER